MNIMNIRVYSDLHLFYDKDDMNRYIYTELNDLKNELLNNPPDYLVFCGDLCHKPYKSDDIRFINIINFITDVVNICTLKNINFRIIQGTSTHDGKIIQLLKYIFRDKPNVICFTEVGYEDVNGYVFRYLPESYFGKYESFYEYAFSKVADITFFHGSVDGVLPMVTQKDNITNLPKSIVIKREDLINNTRLFSVGGHIHKYINLDNKIFYTNSLTTHNFSDIDNVKGYMEFNLDDNYNWDYKYIRNDKAPKYVDYRIDNLQDKTKDELTGLISNLLINLNSKDKVRLSLYGIITKNSITNLSYIKSITKKYNTKIISKLKEYNIDNKENIDEIGFYTDSSVDIVDKIYKMAKEEFNSNMSIDKINKLIK